MTAAVAADVVAGHIQMLVLIVLPAILAVRRLFNYDETAVTAGDSAKGEPDHHDNQMLHRQKTCHLAT